jgi:hypothetical protein
MRVASHNVFLSEITLSCSEHFNGGARDTESGAWAAELFRENALMLAFGLQVLSAHAQA